MQYTNLKVFKVSLKTPDVIMYKREARIPGTTEKITFKFVETIWGIVVTMDTMIIEIITRIRVLKYVQHEKIKVIDAREFFQVLFRRQMGENNYYIDYKPKSKYGSSRNKDNNSNNNNNNNNIYFFNNKQILLTTMLTIKVSATLKIAIFPYLRFQHFQIGMLESFL